MGRVSLVVMIFALHKHFVWREGSRVRSSHSVAVHFLPVDFLFLVRDNIGWGYEGVHTLCDVSATSLLNPKTSRLKILYIRFSYKDSL